MYSSSARHKKAQAFRRLTDMAMPSPHAVLCVLFLWLLAAQPTTAQQTNALEELKRSYESRKLEIDWTYAKREKDAFTEYGKALDAKLAALRQRGELEPYLILEEEKKRFDAEATVPDRQAAGSPFADAVQTYQRTVTAIRAEQTRQATALVTKYTSLLDGLIRQLMQAGKVEAAKAVKVEKDQVTGPSAALNANAPRGFVPRPPLPATLRNGLLLWYDFTTAANYRITDASAHKNHAEIRKGAKWTPDGRVGGGLIFEEAEATSGKKMGIAGNDPRTFAFWIKPTAPRKQIVMELGHELEPSMAMAGRHFGVMVENGSWFLWGCGGSPFDWYAHASPRLGEWSHNVVTYDGTLARWYIDGMELQRGGHRVDYNTIDSRLHFGEMEAVLDEVMVWDRSLSPHEVATLFGYFGGVARQPVREERGRPVTAP